MAAAPQRGKARQRGREQDQGARLGHGAGDFGNCDLAVAAEGVLLGLRQCVERRDIEESG